MAQFVHVLTAVTTFTTYLYVRRRRTWLMALLIALPALLPPLAWYYAPQVAEDNIKILDAVIQLMFVLTITPLTALVYGCSLIAEEIEGKTLPLLLSRAAPRSAIVLGKYFAYCIVAITLLCSSLLLTYGSFALFLQLSLSEHATLLTRYLGVIAFAAVAYGALCVAVGTMTRRPVVVSALFIFGWENLVMALPGYSDFLTLQKYVKRLMPEVPFRRIEIDKVELPAELMREVYPVGYTFAVLALLGATAV
ncbi:MAG TPA: ABC transporter permease subunit, partial [Candidatus Hydrogenedentes bacterium]|nr:ABC transporter permease subunit [Candidatus Hydrogenedentota bacterium]